MRFEALRAYGQGLAARNAVNKLRLLRRALALEPRFEEARLALGREQIEAGEFSAGHDTLMHIPAASPHARAARFLQGRAQLEIGRYQEAAAVYARAGGGGDDAGRPQQPGAGPAARRGCRSRAPRPCCAARSRWSRPRADLRLQPRLGAAQRRRPGRRRVLPARRARARAARRARPRRAGLGAAQGRDASRRRTRHGRACSRCRRATRASPAWTSAAASSASCPRSGCWCSRAANARRRRWRRA